MRSEFLKVGWDAPSHIHAWQTTRAGGISHNGYASLNLASSVGDDERAVAQNRQLLKDKLGLPEEPRWLRLVHGNKVENTAEMVGTPEADASYTSQTGQVLVIPTADCLPVLFVSKNGDEIAAAHAGWRGLSAGVLEGALTKFHCPPADVSVWFGPAIGPANFEVGQDVFDTFNASHPGSNVAFTATDSVGQYMTDIYKLGQLALKNAGVEKFFGGGLCTFDDERFFSYRRQGAQSGRMASVIWIG